MEEENHDEEAMQEVSIPKEINWFNTLVSTYDFAPNDDWTGFDFDDDFNQQDLGQLQYEPIIFDKADLVRRLREAEILKRTKKESNSVIASTLYEFYDKCKNHFHQEFMTLLKALISNVDTSKKLEEKCNASQLLSYYQLKLSSELNFGQHPICQDTAADCNDRLKKLLQECGKQMQVETQLARELTAHKLQAKLLNCGNDFLEFGKDEWMRQCKQTSRFNILDQHFAVKCITEEPEAISEDDIPVELKTASRSNPDETKFQLVKMSTCLFSLAVNDSRRMIDKDIRTRRTQIISAKEREAKKKAVQHEVDMRADAIKPTDAVITLSQRFAKLEARLDELQAGTKAPTSDAAGMAAPAEESIEDEDEEQTTRRLEEFEQRLRALETTGDTAKLHPSKNAMAADSAEPQKSANQQQRRRKRRKADTSSEAASTAAAPTRPNAIPSGAQTQAPRPTTPNNGNTKAKWNSSGQRGRGQNDGDKRRPHNHGQRQQSAERQPDQTQPQRGRGKGRGRGQGPARG